MSRKLLAVLVASMYATTPVSPVRACTCPMLPSVAKAAEMSDVVLRGKAVYTLDLSNSAACRALPKLGPPTDDAIAACGLAVRMRVDAVWKGPHETQATVVTGWGGGDCGARFETGKSYVVFGRRLQGGAIYTDSCTYTDEPGGRFKVLGYLGHPSWTPSA